MTDKIAGYATGKWGLILLLLAYLFIPSMVMATLSQPSYATGMLLLCLLLVFSGIVMRVRSRSVILTGSKKWMRAIIALVVFILLHAAGVIWTFSPLEVWRFIGSLFLLLLLLAAAYSLALIIEYTPDRRFYRVVRTLLFVFVGICIAGILLEYNPLEQAYSFFSNPVFPFIEPSHFAIVGAPFYFWALLIQRSNRNRLLIIVGVASLLLYISNLTLVCLILLGAYLSLGIKRIGYFLLPLLYFLPSLSINTDYYAERLDFDGSSSNISALVWVQGWQEAYIYFKDTEGWGAGFQQFGVADPKGDIASKVYYLLKFYTNRYDGGTFGSKIIGEFGVLGIVLIIGLMYRIGASFVYLRRKWTLEAPDYRLLFYHCCVACFIIELFIRSTSYIAPGFFMFCTGLSGILIQQYRTRYTAT